MRKSSVRCAGKPFQTQDRQYGIPTLTILRRHQVNLGRQNSQSWLPKQSFPACKTYCLASREAFFYARKQPPGHHTQSVCVCIQLTVRDISRCPEKPRKFCRRTSPASLCELFVDSSCQESIISTSSVPPHDTFLSFSVPRHDRKLSIKSAKSSRSVVGGNRKRRSAAHAADALPARQAAGLVCIKINARTLFSRKNLVCFG